MDILENIEEFITENERERGIVIDNDITKSNYIQVEEDIIKNTITPNMDEDITSVQQMPDDAWNNIYDLTNMKGLPEIRRGGSSTKKSKKKRKQSKISRRKNRKK